MSLGSQLQAARVHHHQVRLARGSRPLTLRERAIRALRQRHRQTFHRDRRIGELLAEGYGDTHTARLTSVSATIVRSVRGRLVDEPKSCWPCEHCLELRYYYREAIMALDGRTIRAGPVRRHHNSVRVRARRRGRLLVRRQDRYALLDPDRMVSLEEVARQVDELEPRPGLAPVGRLPGEGDRLVAEVRRLAADAGLLVHKVGESYFILDPADGMDLAQVAEMVDHDGTAQPARDRGSRSGGVPRQHTSRG